MRNLGELLLFYLVLVGPWVLLDLACRHWGRKPAKDRTVQAAAPAPAPAGFLAEFPSMPPAPEIAATVLPAPPGIAQSRALPPEPAKSEAPPPEIAKPGNSPPDPRELLHDWAMHVAKEILARAARGERLAGPELLVPPAPRVRFARHPALLFLIRVPVAGLAYHAYGEEAPRIARGTELFLAREPANPHDALAIAVHGPGGRRIGYFPRRENAVPARLLDAGLPIRAFVFRHVIARGTPIVEIALALARRRRRQDVAA